MSNRWKLWRGWILTVAILAALAFAWRKWSTREVAIDVRSARVERGRVEETVGSTKAGAIRSRRLSDLSVDTAGTITAIHHRQGSRVKAGEHLISIDSREQKGALESAEKELEVLQSLVPEARAKLQSAVRERDRLKSLVGSGSVTASQFDQAASQVDALAADADAASARVAAEQVTVDRARIALEKCDLHAPFDGVVAELWVEVGEWATPGKVAIRLLDPDHLYVRAELDEIDIGALAVDQVARVRLDPFKDRRFEGRIVRVAPYVSELEEQNRTVEIEVEFQSGVEDLELKPGTSADVEVILRAKDGVLRIPTAALIEGSRVLVLDGDRAKEKKVRVGLRNWESVEILEGLVEGERVIASLESEAVKDGVLVRETSPVASPR